MTIELRAARNDQRRLWGGLAVAIAVWLLLYSLNRPFWEWLLFDALGLDRDTHFGAAVEFFFYDTSKIALLLVGIIFAVTVLRSFMSVERTRALLGGRREGVGNVAAAGLGVVSDLGYAAPSLEGSELVVSLKHPGAVSENCRVLSEAEKAKLAPHMRRDEVCERRRAAVRLRVVVDGEASVDTRYPPTGIWGDGNSIAIERIPVAPGEHAVGVTIGDTADPEEWSYADERVLGFDREARRVVTFDRLTGFVWE